jgi:hypothetical protein
LNWVLPCSDNWHLLDAPLSRHQLPLCHDRDAVATVETASWHDHLPVPAVRANVGKMAGPNHPHGELAGLGEGVCLGPADAEDRSGRLDVGGESELSHRFRRPGGAFSGVAVGLVALRLLG